LDNGSSRYCLTGKGLEAGQITEGASPCRRYFRRRKYLINLKLQATLLLVSLSYIAFFIVTLIAALFMPLLNQLHQANQPAWQISEASRQVLFLHGRLWPAFVPGLIAVAIHSISTSHRIAGPLYRFRHVFASIQNGTIPSSARLRKGDLLQSEAKAMNGMLESLRLRLISIHNAEASLSEAIKECSHIGGPCELVSQLDQIRLMNDRLAEQISLLKIEPQ
jgi:methyl-accepting chemotaxis protein